MNRNFVTRLLLALTMASVASISWAQVQVVESDNIQIEVKDIEAGPGSLGRWLQLGGQQALTNVKLSSHWMGIVVRPLDPLLKRHLRLEGGLVVQAVTKDSPAATAGIQADDILLAVNETEITNYQSLMEFFNKNEDKEVTLWYLRDGKKKSAKVKPTKRPEGQAQFFAPQVGGEFNLQGKDPEEIRQWFEKMAKEKWAHGFAEGKQWTPEGDNPLKLRFFHPGVVLGEGVDVDVDVEIDLPKGLQIVVVKQGDEPAKIQVKRGDDEWEVTEKELDKLPEDVRAHVKKYLGRGKGVGIRIETPKIPQIKRLEGARFQAVPRVQARAFSIGGIDTVNKKLDQINERLEKIEQALEKLTDE